MKDQVRLGIIGTSYWADFLLQFLANHPQASPTAICGRNQTRATEIATKHSIPGVFTDYHAMLTHSDLDAVIVATPDDEHNPMAMAALDAGLHVFGEKPMAFNLKQAKEMLAKAESAGLKHMINYTWRYAPYFHYLRQLVAEGFIGKCYDAYFRYQDSYARGSDYQWKWDRQHGLGIVGDLGSHAIDLARLTVGEIAKVHAHLATHVNKPRPDGTPYEAAPDSAILMFQSQNGAQGVIEVSAVVLGDMDQQVCLHGEAGTLKVDANWSDGYTVRGIRQGQVGFQTLEIPDQIMGGVDQHSPFWDQLVSIFSNQSVGVRHLVDCIVQDKPIFPTFYDGVKAQAVIDAAFESDRTGCWADVASTD